jgi:hypothetical protein
VSSWHPSDLVTDQDLVDYESTILTQFGQLTWQAKRTKALEDWLFPRLRAAGFTPHLFRTRFDAAMVLGYTGAVYTDLTTGAQDATADDVNLAGVFATAGTDRLYVGSTEPFRGVCLDLLDAVSSAAGVLSVAYWAGAWKVVAAADGTIATAGKTLSGGGAVTWTLPSDWATRGVNTSDNRYWVRLSVSATPTGAAARQVAVIRASALRAPVAYRTLELIMREAGTRGDGPWEGKAESYAEQAGLAFERALPLLGGEFDTDASGQVSAAEAAQTSAEVGGGWRMERG